MGMACAIAAAVFRLTGCYSGSGIGPDAGPDGDADADTDADSDTDSGEENWSCPLTVEDVCASAVFGASAPYQQIATAEDFGGDIRFAQVHSFGDTPLILARRVGVDDSSPVVLCLEEPKILGYSTAHIALGLAPGEPEGLQPMDLVARRTMYCSDGEAGGGEPHVLGHHAVALLCDEVACFLYGLDTDGEGGAALSRIEEAGTLGPGTLGLVQTPPEKTKIVERVCAFGDGLTCFDGTSWTDEIEAGIRIRSADSDIPAYEGAAVPMVVAVGDGGVILLETEEGWVQLESGTSADLLSVSRYMNVFVAGADDGTVVFWRMGENPLVCPLADEPLVLAWTLGARASLFTSTGRFLQLMMANGSAACLHDEVMDGAPIGLSLWAPSVSATDSLVATETALYARCEWSMI